MKSVIWGVTVQVALASLLGCAGTKAREQREQTVAARAARPPMERMGMLCPAMMPGVDVREEETPEGAAIVFNAPPERAAELRAQVRQIADMHERQPVGGGMHMGGGMHEGMGAGVWRDATVSVEDTQEGARLVFSARDPAEVTALRGEVRAHVERMQAGECRAPGRQGKMEENGGAPPH